MPRQKRMTAQPPGQIFRSLDGRTELAFALDSWRDAYSHVSHTPVFQIAFAGRVMLRSSRLAWMLPNHPDLSNNFELLSVVHRQSSHADIFREWTVRLREQADPMRRINLIFRCYNGAVAMRLRILRQAGLSRIHRPELKAVLRFPEGTQGWIESPDAPGGFQIQRLDSLVTPAAMPLTLVYPHGKMACLTTTDAYDNPTPMSIVPGGVLTRSPSADVHPVTTPHETPWLAMLLADRPCDLPNLRDILIDLGARESKTIHGVEDAQDAVQTCLLPFVRPLAEHVITASKDSIPSTPAHRAAAACLLNTDRTSWDETRFLRGEPGGFVVVARRQRHTWHVAGVTSVEEHVLTVRFEDFLPQSSRSKTYALNILRDPLPDEISNNGIVQEHFSGVKPDDATCLELPSGGGFVLCLEPEA